ncbi:MAG: FG-GAP-like repeat-containing protein, partial [Candidatus Pacebacteria bacterium]|nr:FG-GAP-like repeat-containing protein [Candidatus Paceibacterota bacterium]
MRPVRDQRVPWLYTKGLMQFLRAPALVLAFFVAGLYSPLTLFAAFGDGAPTIFNPDVFTGDSNQVRVEGSSGALLYSIPIKTPKGRNGIEPNLALEYSSQRAEDSIIGYGWSLSIPYIERLNKHGSQSLYYDTASFASSLDGELVRLTSTTTPTHRARVDTGGGRVYTFASNTWIMYDKAGIKYTFGATDSGRQYDTATSSSRTYKWLLQEVRDPLGNVATFTYHTNQNEVYPNTILYSGFNGTNGSMRVSFSTSTRSDVRESYKPGFKVTTAFRISQITLSIASTTVGRYDLSYGTGHNGTRSLLTSVQQFGWDELGSQLSLPPAVFGYTSSSTSFVAPSSNPFSGSSQATIVADTNGNGRADANVFYTTGSATSSNVYVDQTTNVTPSIPEYWATGTSQPVPVEQGVRYLDVNGDGKPDLIRGYENDHTGNTSEHIYLNTYTPATGYGWTASTTFQGDVPPFAWFGNPGASVHTLSSGLFGELNGDGLIDYVMALTGYTGDTTYLGNGSGWTATTSPFAPLLQMPTGLPTEYGSQLVDVNGDGLDDWSYSENGKIYFKLNNGTGWNTSVSTQWTISTSTLFYSSLGGSNYAYLDRGIRFLDINGDGLVDWVRSYRTMPVSPVQIGAFSPEWGETKTVLLNTGNGWATSTSYALPTIVEGIIECACAYPFQGRYTTHELVNWNGNGQMEQDVIRHITYPTGGTKSVMYKPSALLGTNPELPLSLLVVTEVGESNGFGSLATTTYSYSGGKLYLSGGIPDKKFGGFFVATSTSPDSLVAAYFSQGNGADGWAGEVSDGFAQVNKPFRKDIFSTSGTLLQRTYYRFDAHDYLASTFAALKREMVFDYGGTAEHRDRVTEYSYASST